MLRKGERISQMSVYDKRKRTMEGSLISAKYRIGQKNVALLEQQGATHGVKLTAMPVAVVIAIVCILISSCEFYA